MTITKALHFLLAGTCMLFATSAFAQTVLTNINIAGGVTGDKSFLSVPADGSHSDLWSVDDASGRQRWVVEMLPDGYAHILVASGVSNDKVFLSVTPDGSKVDLFPNDDGSGRQRWVVEHLPNGLALIRIFGGVTNGRRYLSVTPDGTKVDLFPNDDGSGRQRWRIVFLGFVPWGNCPR